MSDLLGFVLLVVIVALAIWLAFVIIKWLFILAVVAVLVWLTLYFLRRTRI